MNRTLSPEMPRRGRRALFSAFPLGAGVSVLALACSFGEIDNGGTNITPPSQQQNAEAQPVDGAQPDPGGASANRALNTPAPAPSNNSGAAAAYDPANDPFASSELGKEVKQILEVNCGACHQGSKSGDMDYVLNLEELVKNDKVVPGKKEDSQLWVRMSQGSMPPAFERTQRPTFGQIDQVGQFIDELPTDIFNADDSCTTNPFISLDDQIAAMQSDINRIDSNDQPFTRYLTITDASNHGGCEGDRKEMQRARFALFKGINSVSTNPQVGNPQPIDSAQTIFRIDIRDYNWDRSIDLEDDGVDDFSDGWEAIIAATGDFAVPYTGDQADDLVAAANTAVPFLPVNAFIQFTEFGDLYYALIGGKANLFDFEKEVLKVDTAAELADDNVLRAGYSNSGVSKQERVLNRFDQGTAGGYAYWISFDFDGGSGTNADGQLVRDLANDSIYQNPIAFAFTGGEAIFNLPNGMQAYYVANAKGDRLAEAPVGIVIDPAQNNGKVTTGASCHSCHNAGMITFTDQVRPFVIENKQIFDNETYEHVLNEYPTQAVFQAQMDADSDLHVNAVVRAGIPKGTPDPVSRAYLDFQLGDVTPEIAAGELQVTTQELLDNLQLLDPLLSPLSRKGGHVDRQTFTEVFLDSLCQLHTVDDNQPSNCP